MTDNKWNLWLVETLNRIKQTGVLTVQCPSLWHKHLTSAANISDASIICPVSSCRAEPASSWVEGDASCEAGPASSAWALPSVAAFLLIDKLGSVSYTFKLKHPFTLNKAVKVVPGPPGIIP